MPQNHGLGCSDSFKSEVTCGLHGVEPHTETCLGGTGPKHTLVSPGYQQRKLHIMYKISWPLRDFSLLLHLVLFCEAMQRDTIPF